MTEGADCFIGGSVAPPFSPFRIHAMSHIRTSTISGSFNRYRSLKTNEVKFVSKVVDF